MFITDTPHMYTVNVREVSQYSLCVKSNRYYNKDNIIFRLITIHTSCCLFVIFS